MTGPLTKSELRELKRRNREAVANVVEAHAGDLLRASFGMGLKEVDAEELVSETFATFLDVLDRFEGRSSVRTFLFGILYRKALERGRKRSRELATDPIDQVFESRFNVFGRWSKPPQGPEEEVLSQETARLIGECLDGLTPSQRAAFHLKEVEHESSASICNILGVSDTNLRVILFRSRIKLRECLEKKWRERN
ncbi:MAG: sigma-70 family RNA polymerase sigma factor [Elusimicrobiota bacterium]